jgi:hypothetical protein
MAVFLVCVWSFYLAGAAFGTRAVGRSGLSAIFGAIAILTLALAIDVAWPLPVAEEQEQSDR